MTAMGYFLSSSRVKKKGFGTLWLSWLSWAFVAAWNTAAH
jgi:hypothetical protein